ncbi:MAG TPA: hypothetical protein PKA49_00500 [Tepidiformaceae bacterium]|jgi:pilus assembly protein Flp/PilA|nr:hypothetical protein [Thermoflexaceae bacterium]HMS57301.1 hypothetical protein [Tepidiformaceae bacterium]
MKQRWQAWITRRTQPAGNESGQGLAEYGLILALIAVVCAGALATFGQGLSNLIGWQLFNQF